jgi:DNA-binding CsgD family transcriptional regulator
MRDQLAFGVSDHRQHQNVVLSRAKGEVVLVDRLNTIILTVTGEVHLMPGTAINLLRHFFADEWMDEQHLPDTLSSWLQVQLRIGRLEVLVPMRPWQVTRGSRQLEIELLCDFGAERHLLVLTEQSIAFPLAQQLRSIGLSNREAEVLILVSTGKTNLQIAEELTISLQTVKKHIANIFGKLNAHNRTDAVNKARQQFDD